jgi:hypothetical protein
VSCDPFAGKNGTQVEVKNIFLLKETGRTMTKFFTVTVLFQSKPISRRGLNEVSGKS